MKPPPEETITLPQFLLHNLRIVLPEAIATAKGFHRLPLVELQTLLGETEYWKYRAHHETGRQD